MYANITSLTAVCAILWMIAAGALFPAYAGQAPRAPVAFEHLSVDQGLSQVAARAILQDRKGFLWIATENGLNRFDGYGFRIFKHRPDDPASLESNTILSLCAGDAGVLWVGTDGGGLNRYDPHTEAFTRFRHDPADPHTISTDSVGAVCRDRRGHLWAGARWRGALDRFDPAAGEWRRYASERENPQGFWGGEGVTAIIEDRRGRILIGTDGAGVNILDTTTGVFGHWSHEPSNPRSLSSDLVTGIFEDREGSLWITTYGGGLNRRIPDAEGFRRFRHTGSDPDSIGSDHLRTVYEDSTGTLWIGTDHDGLDRLERSSGRFIHYRPDPAEPRSLSHFAILSICEDRGGILWFGSQLGGLNKFNRFQNKFQTIRVDPTADGGLVSNDIKSLCQGRNGEVWLSAGGNLHRLNRGTGRITRYGPPAFDLNGIMTVLADHQGTLWLGTWNLGLKRFDPDTGRIRTFYTDPIDAASWSANTVMTLHETRDGVLWVGTFDRGLGRFDRKREGFTWYRHDPDDPDSLSHNLVLTLFEDAEGGLWVGTGGGLNRFHPESGDFTGYPAETARPGGLGDTHITAIVESKTGQFWIGTTEGLYRFAPESGAAVRYTEADGLADNSIAGILMDEGGSLWISTTRGLSRFDPESKLFRNFDPADGLQSFEFNRSAALRCRDGEMVFGGVRGLNRFYPDAIRDRTYRPPVVLTELRILNMPVVPADAPCLDRAAPEAAHIHLTHRDYLVSFEFAALDFANPRKNQYAYRLDGFDTDWVHIGERRTATYTNLPAGDYLFRAKGTNSDGVWSDAGLAVAVHVAPPWWGTLWFRAVALLFAAALLIGGYRWRVKRFETRNRELENHVAERTRDLSDANRRLADARAGAEAANRAKTAFIANMSHELRTPLNAILGYAQLMRRDGELSDRRREAVETIHKSGEHLLTLIDDLLDLSRIESRRFDLAISRVHLPRFFRSIQEIIEIQARKKRLVFVCDLSPGLPAWVRTDEKRLRQILLNLLSNGVKFTHAGDVRLRVRKLDRAATAGASGPAPAAASTVRLRFEAADTGIGIHQGDLGRIFLPFHQAGAPENRPEGTGLGLAICRQLVRMMGGDLAVRSQPGRGSVFSFELELEVSTVEEPVPAGSGEGAVVGYEGPRRRILIADDSEPNRMVLRAMLGPLDFELAEAADGREALAAVDTFRPDAVLMDLVMPVVDGFEATRRIRRIDTDRTIVVIGVSASLYPEIRRENVEAGCDDFLAKPVVLESLLATLQTRLGLTWRRERMEKRPPVPTESKPVDVEVVPPDLPTLADLHRLAVDGDLVRLLEALETLGTDAPHLVPFVRQMRTMARALRLDDMENWLATWLNPRPEKEETSHDAP